MYDRTCRLLVDYQDAREEGAIVDRAVGDGGVDEEWREKLVDLVRRTRTHPEVRIGSSVRGAIDATAVAASLSELRGLPVSNPSVGLDGVDRPVRPDPPAEGTTRTAEEIVTELWAEVFGRRADGEGQEKLAPRMGPPAPTREEGAAADQAVAEASRRTASRRELGRHEHFEDVSPEVEPSTRRRSSVSWTTIPTWRWRSWPT